MGGVTTTIVDEVHMVTMRDGNMAAPVGVHVVMPLMNAVFTSLALVVVAVMGFVQVSIVDIVDMVDVRHGDMPTPRTVGVVVSNMLVVRSGHWRIPFAVVG
jgi:hypothetical protein